MYWISSNLIALNILITFPVLSTFLNGVGFFYYFDLLLFARSLPFVAEKLTELLLVFLNLVNDVEEDERESDELFNKEETDKINTKVETVGKMLQLYKKLREQRETVCSCTF